MEIVRLNKATWLPEAILRSFSELSWLERYQTNGEFKLVVENDISVLTTFPLESMISHTDTKEVMIVEDHEVRRENGTLKVTITGRSFETFLENRWYQQMTSPGFPLELRVSDESGIPGTGDLYPPDFYDAASVASLGGFIEYLIYRSIVYGFVTAYDIIPNVSASTDISTSQNLGSEGLSVPNDTIYNLAMKFLKLADHGIQTVRPIAGEGLVLKIHDGTDLSATLRFTAVNQDFLEAVYFKSVNKYKNVAMLIGRRWVTEWDLITQTPIRSGLNRREVRVEVDIDWDSMDFTGAASKAAMLSYGAVELTNTKKLDLIQCKISPLADPKFKTDYNIGDFVTVVGEFGTIQKMRVTEHILTSDKSGTKGYPTLTAV